MALDHSPGKGGRKAVKEADDCGRGGAGVPTEGTGLERRSLPGGASGAGASSHKDISSRSPGHSQGPALQEQPRLHWSRSGLLPSRHSGVS